MRKTVSFLLMLIFSLSIAADVELSLTDGFDEAVYNETGDNFICAIKLGPSDFAQYDNLTLKKVKYYLASDETGGGIGRIQAWVYEDLGNGETEWVTNSDEITSGFIFDGWNEVAVDPVTLDKNKTYIIGYYIEWDGGAYAGMNNGLTSGLDGKANVVGYPSWDDDGNFTGWTWDTLNQWGDTFANSAWSLKAVASTSGGNNNGDDVELKHTDGFTEAVYNETGDNFICAIKLGPSDFSQYDDLTLKKVKYYLASDETGGGISRIQAWVYEDLGNGETEWVTNSGEITSGFTFDGWNEVSVDPVTLDKNKTYIVGYYIEWDGGAYAGMNDGLTSGLDGKANVVGYPSWDDDGNFTGWAWDTLKQWGDTFTNNAWSLMAIASTSGGNNNNDEVEFKHTDGFTEAVYNEGGDNFICAIKLGPSEFSDYDNITLRKVKYYLASDETGGGISRIQAWVYEDLGNGETEWVTNSDEITSGFTFDGWNEVAVDPATLDKNKTYIIGYYIEWDGGAYAGMNDGLTSQMDGKANVVGYPSWDDDGNFTGWTWDTLKQWGDTFTNSAWSLKALATVSSGNNNKDEIEIKHTDSFTEAVYNEGGDNFICAIKIGPSEFSGYDDLELTKVRYYLAGDETGGGINRIQAWVYEDLGNGETEWVTNSDEITSGFAFDGWNDLSVDPALLDLSKTYIVGYYIEWDGGAYAGMNDGLTSQMDGKANVVGYPSWDDDGNFTGWTWDTLKQWGDTFANSAWSLKAVCNTSTTGVEEELKVNKVSSLEQNYPNPFNPVTTISYNVAETGKVNLAVFNSKGELVKELVNGVQINGKHKATFDGSSLNSGVYFYKLKAGNNSIVKRMVLIK